MKKIKVTLVVRDVVGPPRYLIDNIVGALTVGGQNPGGYISKQEAQMLIDSPVYVVTVRKPSL